jgi:hypothetical protein
MRLLQEDLFAPVLALITFDTDEEAVVQIRRCPYALGAAIFSRDTAAARDSLAQSRLALSPSMIDRTHCRSARPLWRPGTQRLWRNPRSGRVARNDCLEGGSPSRAERRAGISTYRQTPSRGLFTAWIAAAHGNGSDRWRALGQLWRAIKGRRRKSSSS